jgi:TIR domain/SIR2-like domain
MSAETDGIANQEWRRLTSVLRRGTCIAFVGQDAVISSGEQSGRSLWGNLAREILESLGDRNLDRDLDFFAAAEYHDREHGDRFALEDTVLEFFGRYRNESIATHDLLADLPIPLYLYTGVDDLLYTAVKKKKPKAQFACYNHNKGDNSQKTIDGSQIESFSADKPLVYNLYGYLAPDAGQHHCVNDQSAILTERDLLEFMIAVAKKSPPLPTQVSTCLNDPEMSFIFLGVRFHQWYGRILLQLLRETSRRYASIALERGDFFRHPEHSAVSIFFNKSQKIKFRQSDLVSLLQELSSKTKGLRQEKVAELTADAPTVFLSYASEDEDKAVAFARSLVGSGIRPWIDKQELRGGDKWRLQLLTVISKHVDYFILLHSESMVSRPEGVYWEECNAAIDRQKRMRPGIKFLIPASLDSSHPPNIIVDEYHVVDISLDEGADSIVEIIKHDWNQRQKEIS